MSTTANDLLNLGSVGQMLGAHHLTGANDEEGSIDLLHGDAREIRPGTAVDRQLQVAEMVSATRLPIDDHHPATR